MAGSGWVNKPPTLSRAYSLKLLTISRRRRVREAAADAGCEQAMLILSACIGNSANSPCMNAFEVACAGAYA